MYFMFEIDNLDRERKGKEKKRGDLAEPCEGDE